MRKALDYLYTMKNANEQMGQEAININEAIDELEDLQSRSCNECKHYLDDNGNYPLEPCSECSRFYSDKFERLEK
ncbi:hypothetical protein NG767_02975 [Aliarcobacter cryaerophilus]|uniref:hypothetical protein n=1 Tax=Aliarcobacter cryaerophilus TaxID=28198 RepID=UPI003DA4ED62